MSERVEFTEEAVKSYLDVAIRLWRKNKSPVLRAHYVDAFQSVRSSLFGGILPQDGEDAEATDG